MSAPAGHADAPPLSNEAPCTEEVRLHVQPVKPVHVPRGIGPVQVGGGHAFNLEIVLWLTLKVRAISRAVSPSWSRRLIGYLSTRAG
jgi:hypothetical protein